MYLQRILILIGAALATVYAQDVVRTKRSEAILNMFRHLGGTSSSSGGGSSGPKPAADPAPRSSSGGNNGNGNGNGNHGNNGNHGGNSKVMDLFKHESGNKDGSKLNKPAKGDDQTESQQPSNEQPYSPSERMDECCRVSPKVGDGCRSKMCAYERFTKDALINAYLTRQCSPPEFDSVLACANRCEDQRACCQSKNLPPVCDFFCASRHMPHPGSDMMKFLPCADRLNDIVGCFVNFEQQNPMYPSQGMPQCD